jgi:DNA polymerase-3 subunit delta
VQKTELSVDCRPPEMARGRGKPVPDTARIARWLRSRGESDHQCQLQSAAADSLLELVGLNFGLLDQELAKLALFVEPGQSASPQLVRQVCGGWRTQTTWDMIDAAASGQSAAALQQLDQLLRAGEAPQAVFAQVSWSLRRFAVATRIYALAARRGERVSLRDALQAAGILSFRLKQAEQQLRQIGQARAARLLSWLMEADLALKGSHSAPPRARFALEQLVMKLAAEAA